MKQLITPTYTFTPATKTIDFTDFVFDVKRLVAIINLTSDTIIYGTGISGKGYDTSTASQIVLDFDTTAMAGSDVLQFIYDTEGSLPVAPDILNTGSGGSEVWYLVSTASTNINVVKAYPGNLYSITVFGLTDNVRYLKVYNKATEPVIASDSGLIKFPIPIPTSTSAAGATINFTRPINFSNGISIAITGAIGVTDATAIAANDCVVIIAYG